MAQLRQCPDHNIEMVFHPEGVGKRGQYNAFWGCPKYPDCKQTLPVPKEDSQKLSQDFQFNRDKQMAYGGAANRAVEIGAKTKEEFEDWFNFFMGHWEKWYQDNIKE